MRTLATVARVAAVIAVALGPLWIYLTVLS
jgi:hypothetical protein